MLKGSWSVQGGNLAELKLLKLTATHCGGGKELLQLKLFAQESIHAFIFQMAEAFT